MSALVPIEQKQVIFYEDEIMAVLVETGNERTVYIPLRPVCEYLGIDWGSQYKRLQRDVVLLEQIRSVVITTTDRGNRDMLCLPVDFIPGWLFSMNAGRVKEAHQEKIIRYQRECYKVLANAFQEGRLPVTAESPIDELLKADTPAAQAYRMAHAIMQMARQQVIMEARIESHESRLELLEAQLGDQTRAISESQAMQISQAVKLIGMVWSKEEKRNLYGAVYGRLYERFEITSYRQLPARHFKEAMAWLTGWYTELTGSAEIPF